MHAGALLPGGIHVFTEAECDEILTRFYVADILAVFYIEQESPAYDGFQRRGAIPDQVVQAFSNLPILRGGFTELGKDGRITFLCEHIPSFILHPDAKQNAG